MTDPLCHICNTVSVYLLNKDSYDLYRCPKCALVFVHPQPHSDFLATKVYSKDSGYQGGKAKDLSKVPLTKAYHKIFSYLERKGAKGTVLDIGCSNGEFLYGAKVRGFKGKGVELNSYTAGLARANGLEVYDGSLADVRNKPGFEDGGFDIIFLGDLIEHVSNPRGLLLECKTLLAPSGRIIISTPNLDCIWAKATYVLYTFIRIPWSSVTPPYHLFQFSHANLLMLLNQCGIGHEATWYNGRPPLSYERGSTHLVKVWRGKKGISRIIFGAYMFFSLGLQALLYVMVDLIGLLGYKNDFCMIVVGEKKN
jgi:SAM-dependent methyltransferase